jgi:hypothetical protein
MRNKIQNIQDLEYSNNQILIGETIKKWLKTKPKNKELLDLRDAFIDNSIYKMILLLVKWLIVNIENKETKLYTI